MASKIFVNLPVKDLNHAKQFIDRVHLQALQQDPKANLPQMTYLDGD